MEVVERTFNVAHRCTHLVLHLDNQQLRYVGIEASLAVVETDTSVDGDALTHSLVHQGDALETVLQAGMERGRTGSCELRAVSGVGRVLPDEVDYFRDFQCAVEQGYIDGYAYFVRLLLVVFVLDFEEGGVGGTLGAHTEFLAVELLVVVHGVHVECCGVEIECAVGGEGF